MSELAGIIEALLFAAAEPLPLKALIEATGSPDEDVQAALEELGYALEPTGLRLQSHVGRWQLVTAAKAAEAIKRHLTSETRADLSRAALETLAMIAYRGPVTRTAIDELRGVSSDTMLRNLLARGLVVEQGHANEEGRPALYVVSHRFLEHVGLSSLAELPPLDEAAPREA